MIDPINPNGIHGSEFQRVLREVRNNTPMTYDPIENRILLPNNDWIDIKRYHSSEQSYILDLIRPLRTDLKKSKWRSISR